MRSGSELEIFSRACGLDKRLVVEVEGPDREGKVFHEFSQPFVVLGRHPQADISLPHPYVGLRHIYLQILDGRVLALDLASRTGTWQAGQPIFSAWIDAQRELEVGPWRIRVLRSEPIRSVPLDDPLSAQSSGQAWLTPLGLVNQIGSDGVRTWMMRSALALVGRAPTCRVRVDSRSLAPCHAALVRTSEGPWIVDLLGPGGVLVNGRRVRVAPLNDGDNLRVGSLRLSIRRRVTGGAARPRERPEIVAFPRTSLLGSTTASRETLPAVMTSTTIPSMVMPENPLVETTGTNWNQLMPLLYLISSHFGQTQQQMLNVFQQMMQSFGRTFSDLHDQHAAQLREELDQIQETNRKLAEFQSRMLEHVASSPPPVHPISTPVTRGNDEETSGKRIVPPSSFPPLPPTEGASTDIHAEFALRIVALQNEQQGRWRRLLDLVARPS